MPYTREEIPAEDLDLKSKERALQARDLRPDSDNKFTNNATEVERDVFPSRISTETESVLNNGVLDEQEYSLNQQFTNEEKFGQMSDNAMHSHKQLAVNSLEIHDKDRVQLKSDSLDIDDLIKTTNTKTNKDLQKNQYGLNNVENSALKNNYDINRGSRAQNNQNFNNIENQSEKTYSNRVLHHTQDGSFRENNTTVEGNYSKNSTEKIVSKLDLKKEIAEYTKKSHELEINKQDREKYSFENKFNHGNKSEIIIEKPEKKERDLFGIKKKKNDLEILNSKPTREEKIEFILDLIKNDGVEYGVKIAEKTRDWYILDTVHDKLHTTKKN